MAEQVVVTKPLYLGRGLQGEPFPETGEKLELSVDLYDLGTDYAAGWLEWAGVGGPDLLAATQAWMPLVDSTGTCVLDSTGALIPTLITL